MSEFKIIWGGKALTANTSCVARLSSVDEGLLESKFLDGDTLKEDEPNDTTADVYILEENDSTRKLHVFPTRSQDGIVATYKIDNDGDSCKLLNSTSNIWYKELDIIPDSGAMFTVIADYDDWANIQSTSSRIVDNSAPKDWFSFPQRGDRVCKFKFKTNNQGTNIGMFKGCTRLKSVILPYSITSISTNTFNGCSNLVSYGDADHITSIGTSAFSDCTSLTTAEFGKFLLKANTGNQLGDAAFSGCTSLTSINYYIEYGDMQPDNCHALNIPNNCFKGCTSLKGNNDKTTQLDIYGNVGDASFSGCTSLKKVWLSNNVTSIGTSAFNGCAILENVTINRTTPPTLGANAFDSTHSNLAIYVPSSSVDTYKATSGWSAYASKIQAIQ